MNSTGSCVSTLSFRRPRGFLIKRRYNNIIADCSTVLMQRQVHRLLHIVWISMHITIPLVCISEKYWNNIPIIRTYGRNQFIILSLQETYIRACWHSSQIMITDIMRENQLWWIFHSKLTEKNLVNLQGTSYLSWLVFSDEWPSHDHVRALPVRQRRGDKLLKTSSISYTTHCCREKINYMK